MANPPTLADVMAAAKRLVGAKDAPTHILAGAYNALFEAVRAYDRASPAKGESTKT